MEIRNDIGNGLTVAKQILFRRMSFVSRSEFINI